MPVTALDLSGDHLESLRRALPAAPEGLHRGADLFSTAQPAVRACRRMRHQQPVPRQREEGIADPAPAVARLITGRGLPLHQGRAIAGQLSQGMPLTQCVAAALGCEGGQGPGVCRIIGAQDSMQLPYRGGRELVAQPGGADPLGRWKQ